MNELSLFTEVTEKTVTTKELAETLGVEVTSVKRAVQKLGAVLHSVRKNSQGGFLFYRGAGNLDQAGDSEAP